MAKDKSADKSQSKVSSWFQGLKAEYNKIVWTDKETLGRQTVAVVVITAILCVVISLMDSGILELINLFMG